MNAEKVAQARLERKMAQGAKKASGTKVKGSGSDESEEENDNHKAGKMMKAADLGAPREMSRRERFVSHSAFLLSSLTPCYSEQADKAAAKERYAKLHAAGKVIPPPSQRNVKTNNRTTQTDEAKADLGRLAQIRKQRELAAAQRIAETAGQSIVHHSLFLANFVMISQGSVVESCAGKVGQESPVATIEGARRRLDIVLHSVILSLFLVLPSSRTWAAVADDLKRRLSA